MTLPPVSELLLRLSIPREFQTEILGDLAEEYHRRSASSERAARRWIRRDAITAAFSFPGAGMNAWAAAAAVIAAYSFAIVWELIIASPVARMAALSGGASASALSWPAFLTAQMAGFAIAGALAAALIRRKRQGTLMGLLLGAAPLVAAIIAPVILFAALNHDAAMVGRRLGWFAASILAVIGGASLSAALGKR